MRLRADLVPLPDQQWRLISPDGVFCTLVDPPEEWVDALRLGSYGYESQFDGELERALARHNMLAEISCNGRVLVIGGGLVAAEVCLNLAQAGIVVEISAPEAAQVALDPLGFHTSAAAAIRAWVGERCPTAHTEVAPHWTALTAGEAAVAIVATPTVQPDRAITDHLARHFFPHLVVRAHHDSATVGPFIDAGGPCLACLDLAQADHDELWPKTLAILTSHPSQPSTLAAHWAGVQTALETTWFLQGAGTTLRASTIEIDATHSGTARRHWYPHKDCACRYPSVADAVTPISTPQVAC